MKFLTDEMEGNLTSWLRFLGYDTKYAKDFELMYGTPVDDDSLIEECFRDHRILITRDRDMANRFKKKFNNLMNENPEEYKKFEITTDSENTIIPLIMLETDDFLSSMAIVHQIFKIRLDYDSDLALCSKCNSHIKKVRDKRIYKEKIPKAVYSNTRNFWICQNEDCGKIYWIGGHFEDILSRLDEIKKKIR